MYNRVSVKKVLILIPLLIDLLVNFY